MRNLDDDFDDTDRIKSVEQEIRPILDRCSDEEIARFFHLTLWLIRRYLTGYELDGTIYLVLDNCIIQDFKHLDRPESRIKALAYTVFCRFVEGWSDRETNLCISPVAVYEHSGQRISDTPEMAWRWFDEIRELLAITGLEVGIVGFNDPHSLHDALHRIHHDSDYLTVFVQQIKETEWRRDLRLPTGAVLLPIGIASACVPDDMPLRYFDLEYVKRVFISRIEQRIIEQSKHDLQTQPIGSGELSTALASLNKIKRGVLRGLGDIDLLQICDISRQYRNPKGYIFLGQTFDAALTETLRLHHRYVKQACVQGGSRHVKKELQEMLGLMFSKPFERQYDLAAKIRPRALSFSKGFAAICKKVLSGRSPVET